MWKWERANLPSVNHSARTAFAATVSFVVARLFRLPEAYWAAIATVVVMESTWRATLASSLQRIVATALGAGAGALMATYFGSSALAFGVSAFLIGFLCWLARLEKGAYRYACVTLAIVMLVPRLATPWAGAVHRFFEVSLGIAIALVVTAVWPERESSGGKFLRFTLGHEKGSSENLGG
ncbi:MAG TPA: FUSC family protein [Chthoniobacterales bacterium]|nr:FUSC family protein [Chthoniobacterales bacterium]